MPNTDHQPAARRRHWDGLVGRRVAETLDREITVPPPTVTTAEKDVIRTKLQLDRATGTLRLDHVRPDPNQPRQVDTGSEDFRDLVASIRAHGVLSPITVRYVAEGDYFRIIAGERRYRAALAAGLDEIGAIVKDIDDTVTAVEQIEENIHRKNFSPLEEAGAVRRLMSATGETQEQVALRIHKSPTHVSRLLAIDGQLTRQEKAHLTRLAPAQAPGVSLIQAALKASDPKLRAAILSGDLTRAQARHAVTSSKRRPSGGRPSLFQRTFRAEQIGATVTIRFNRKNASSEDVLHALEAARSELKGETH